MHDPLSALAAAEARYTGPLPPATLEFVRYGSQGVRDLLAADAQLAFFRQRIRGQVRAIRARRADGSFFPAMLDDLACYRRGFREALRQRQAVRARIKRVRKREAA